MSDRDEERDISIKKKFTSNYELKTVRAEKLASLSKSYSDIYKKYGYPTFKCNKKPSRILLPQLDESDYFDQSDIKQYLLKEGEKSESKVNCTHASCSYQSDLQSVLKPYKDSSVGEASTMIIGKSIYFKKNKRKRICICTTHCRYSCIRRVAALLGMREVLETEPWSFMWLDSSITVDKVKHMKRYQRINHFPGMMEICRKDLLARNLNRMRKTFPNDYNFFPHTWSLPTELNEALKYNSRNKNKTFILKPECSSQGKGIFLIKNLRDLSKVTERFICQQYISKPYTIDGFKFDIRIYTLISSCDPLRVYVYNEGLVRFATQRYAIPDCKNTGNHFIHLTNFSINRRSANFVYDQDKGSKRKISTINTMLKSRGIDIDRTWQEIDKCIVKTIIAGWPMIRHNYKACFPTHDKMSACFEILGFDILLDYKLRPYILEVNHSPSFHTDTPLDEEVKENLLLDTFHLLNMNGCDSRKIMDEDRKRTRERLCLSKGSSKISVDEKVSSNLDDKFPAQDKWEMAHLGNFRRVYPSDSINYNQFFNQQAGSLYTTTESIRRKADCAKQLRSDLARSYIPTPSPTYSARQSKTNKTETKAKNDSQKKFITITKECREASPPLKVNPNIENIAPKKPEASEAIVLKPLVELFEPLPYLDVDERKRLTLMENRSNLVKTYGITRQVYKLMKDNGTLRENDIRKYGLFDKNIKLKNVPSGGSFFDVNNNDFIAPNKLGLHNNKVLPGNSSSTNIDLYESLDSWKNRRISWSNFDKQMDLYSDKINMMKLVSNKLLVPISERTNNESLENRLKDNLIVKTFSNQHLHQ